MPNWLKVVMILMLVYSIGIYALYRYEKYQNDKNLMEYNHALQIKHAKERSQ